MTPPLSNCPHHTARQAMPSVRTVTQGAWSLNSSSANAGKETLFSIGSLTLTNSRVLNNNSFSTYGGGGGIYAVGTFTATDSRIAGNAASIAGGGILNDFGTVTLTNTTVVDNRASQFGGGIFNGKVYSPNEPFLFNNPHPGSLTLNQSTIAGNNARLGGDIYNDVATAARLNAGVVGNRADVAGRGIANLGFLTVDGSSIDGNSAPSGGGIRNTLGAVSVTDSVVTRNVAAARGALRSPVRAE